MVQPPLFSITPIFTVSELTGYLRELFRVDPQLQDVWIQGEISNLSFPQSGHIYFSLKDESATLRCVIWKFTISHQRSILKDGLKIEAHGHVDLYEKGGQYQLYIDDIRPLGEGVLFQEFLRLKDRLEAEGLFQQERKRSLPGLPQIIGIITSPTGAALQDILRTLLNRYPLAEVILAPSSVQGETAPLEIIAALESLQRILKRPDVIMIARGGGSLEDLWAFNDERVVRAIAASDIPIITGIGHETDFTLSDFAADFRAPTPTGAAVNATPDVLDLQSTLSALVETLNFNVSSHISTIKRDLQDAVYRLKYNSPFWQIQNYSQRLDELSERLQRAVTHLIQLDLTKYQGSHNRLLSLNPLAILQRGYALVKTSEGALVHSITEINIGDQLLVQMVDGQIKSRVDETSPTQGLSKIKE